MLKELIEQLWLPTGKIAMSEGRRDDPILEESVADKLDRAFRIREELNAAQQRTDSRKVERLRRDLEFALRCALSAWGQWIEETWGHGQLSGQNSKLKKQSGKVKAHGAADILLRFVAEFEANRLCDGQDTLRWMKEQFQISVRDFSREKPIPIIQSLVTRNEGEQARLAMTGQDFGHSDDKEQEAGDTSPEARELAKRLRRVAKGERERASRKYKVRAKTLRAIARLVEQGNRPLIITFRARETEPGRIRSKIDHETCRWLMSERSGKTEKDLLEKADLNNRWQQRARAWLRAIRPSLEREGLWHKVGNPEPGVRAIEFISLPPDFRGLVCSADHSQSLVGHQTLDHEKEAALDHINSCSPCKKSFIRVLAKSMADHCASAVPSRPRVMAKVLKIAAAFLVSATALGVLGANGLSWWQHYQELEKRVYSNDYISFIFDDAAHPSTDPVKARPVFVLGQEFRVKGHARGHLIDKIVLTVEPGLTEQKAWQKVVELGGNPENERALPVPFDVGFAAPVDGARRAVTIRLVPHKQALKALGRHFHEGFMTYTVHVACLPTGPVAYVPQILELENLRSGDTITHRIIPLRGKVHEDGFLAVIIQDPEGTFHLQAPPVPVKAGQLFGPIPINFGKPDAGVNDFTVHFAYYRSHDAWPKDLRVGPLPGGRPTSAIPGTEIQYSEIKVKVQL